MKETQVCVYMHTALEFKSLYLERSIYPNCDDQVLFYS